ncbi:MAG TPA: T9SS type A sorting domain-containing protein [Hanamia sp.]
MKKQFYSQKFSLISGEISANKKFKGWPIAFITLLISLFSLNGIAQTISNVGISTAAVCPGSTVSISFTVTNGTSPAQTFTTSTNYTLYASNSSGTGFTSVFSSTSATAPAPGAGNSAVITLSNLTTPASFPLGTGYKVSISSDVPNIPSNSGTNVSAPFAIISNPTISYSKVFASCQGNDGSINVTASGGTSPYTFTWTGYPTDGSYSGSTPAITNLPVGDYTIVVKDNNACTATVLGIAIKQAPPVSVGISENIPTCAGNDGSISAFRIGGVYDGINPIQYNINGGAYQTSGIFNGLTAGNYTVTAKDSKGCIGSISVNLPIDTRPAPSVGYQITEPGCAGNDGTITAYRVGGVYDGIHPIQLNIDGGAYQTVDAASPLSLFSGLSAGTHTVTVKDSRGCTGSAAIVLTQAAPLVFTPNGYNTNVSACGGGSDGSIVATVSGGVPPYTYSLNTGVHEVSSLQTFGFTGLLPNTPYTVTVTDTKGCGILKSVTLSQESAPIASVNYTGNVTCIGGNDGFITSWQSGGVPGYMYSSNGGTTYQDSYRFLNLVAGTYNVVVKDSKGCSSAPVPVTIADGTVACTQGRMGGNTTDNNSNRVGNAVEEINPLSKTALNTALSIQAYPNPSAPSSDFTLDVHGNSTDQVLIFVTDVLGRKCYQAQGNSNQQYKLGSNLRPGIYFVQVLQGDNVQTIKIVKE